MTRFSMGALLGASAGFLICAIIEPDALGVALQGVYWFLKLKRRKVTNG